MGNIDELLIEAKRVCGERWQKAPEYPWEVAAQFGAEVERLRADVSALESRETMLLDQIGKLEAEVDSLRHDRETFLARAEKVEATLAWFERWEEKARRAIWVGGFANRELVRGNLECWESKNPKPKPEGA